MDGTAAISNNIEALKRIVTGLLVMAGDCLVSSSRAGRSLAHCEENAPPPDTGPCPRQVKATLPRHLRLAILRLLRPAEAAARRLIIASARGLVVTLPPPSTRAARPVAPEPFLRRFGIAVVLTPADISREAAARRAAALRAARTRTLCLPLFDPVRRSPAIVRLRVRARSIPRIVAAGIAEPFPLPPARSPNDPVDASRLHLRLDALASALGDLPAQARRFARWQALRKRRLNLSLKSGGLRGNLRPVRASPLRAGRPPGGRLAHFDPSARDRSSIREVDEVLAHAHALALYALENPDTS